ncbi:hypothetical protein [Acanthamoeba castellanii mimivirus]|uniref:Uncharacterized protein L48 n=6 Tax=Mimivirus TaxID=315393 RepID=YL048_MIMIV|nr:hypothetical protein MIMI_gp0060 [Acanthamoeba polyphaga mimivirus]Q5UPC4.1 RecName: Full=Uncharacterized protein L48 [Acanthamoeba polyphaga mimivirus]AHJ39870.1 hypothetical protein [Samba virus]AMZ02499.1 hypothetical protein [Mimivirus Bombay]QTF48945.1 hypothetical protein [Mimivirus reunion]WMV61388.1 hypothetical protein qu_50 [Mimivirus sp.]BAV61127.1 hypothetical protein [Acanthamoeba castellanii mimivirus]
MDIFLCPVCQSGYRYFYTLYLPNNNIDVILFCDECECVWIDPEYIDYQDAVSNDFLVDKYKVTSCKILFNKEISGWSTNKDIKNSRWDNFIENYEQFVFQNIYHLDKNKRYPFLYLYATN